MFQERQRIVWKVSKSWSFIFYIYGCPKVDILVLLVSWDNTPGSVDSWKYPLERWHDCCLLNLWTEDRLKYCTVKRLPKCPSLMKANRFRSISATKPLSQMMRCLWTYITHILFVQLYESLILSTIQQWGWMTRSALRKPNDVPCWLVWKILSWMNLVQLLSFGSFHIRCLLEYRGSLMIKSAGSPFKEDRLLPIPFTTIYKRKLVIIISNVQMVKQTWSTEDYKANTSSGNPSIYLCPFISLKLSSK